MTRTTLFFDGHCERCCQQAAWLKSKDRNNRVDCISMHDPAAAEILGNRLDTFLAEDTVGLLHRGKLYLKSTAACRALALIGFPYSLGALGLLVPPSIRNFIYNKIARNRHSSH